MKQEHDDYLVEKYPKLFKNRYADMTETCMCWGFECGDGWFNIINNLCSLIQGHIDWRNDQRDRTVKYNAMIQALQAGDATLFDQYYQSKDPAFLERMRANDMVAKPREVAREIPQVVVDQVKEKFGTLRFYYTGGDDEISGMVRMAEAMSSVTCESCAAPTKTNWPEPGGWVTTLCEPCSDRRERDRQRRMQIQDQSKKEVKHDNNYQFIGEDSGSHD